MGQTLVVVGLIIVAIGVLVWLGVPLGRLPGDTVIRREGLTLYLPITTSILATQTEDHEISFIVQAQCKPVPTELLTRQYAGTPLVIVP